MEDKSSITFRPAGFADSNFLLKCRNDEETRRNSIDTPLISQETHEKWLKSAMENPKIRLFIAETGAETVGTVRFELKNDNEWQMSWTVAPQYRGKGLGKEIVKKGLNLISGPVTAQVKDHNVGSTIIAQYAGFKFIKNDSGITYWKLSR